MSFLFFILIIFFNIEKVIRIKGVKLFIILTPSYFYNCNFFYIIIQSKFIIHIILKIFIIKSTNVFIDFNHIQYILFIRHKQIYYKNQQRVLIDFNYI